MNKSMYSAQPKIEDWLRLAVEVGASDLHIIVGSPPIFRIDGQLHSLTPHLVDQQLTENYAHQLLNEQEIERFKTNREIDFAYEMEGVSRFRINAFYQRGWVSFAIRVIPGRIPTFEELRLPPILKEIVQRPQGLILVTGPTGSGKSTTLATMIDYVNRTERKHILTLEDPIEYLHQHQQSIVNQREIGKDSAMFSSGLRAALRQDPDIILVGEMRDLETISTAITAAETGHLVLATLHTLDAPSTIDRIIDVFPEGQQAQIRVQLASVLVAILSQRLIPKASERGRMCAMEIMLNTPAVANLIRQEKAFQLKSIIQTNHAIGMQTLEMSIQQALSRGEITKETAQLYLKEPTNLF